MNVSVELGSFTGDRERDVCAVNPKTMLILGIRRKMWFL